MGEQRGGWKPALAKVPILSWDYNHGIPRIEDVRMSRRLYIALTTMDAGSDAHSAIRSVHEAEEEHPEWDMDEMRTRGEWDAVYA